MQRPGDGAALDTVRHWRSGFAHAGLPGLKDGQRCGRPASFTPLQAAEVKALACRLPAESEVPLSRWSCPELAREAARWVSPRSCRRRPCAAGWPRTRSSPGSTAPGSSSPAPASG
ncbi:helix-turn-helix domain-containing protein [Streptomyces sp. NPDC050636]|uniref:helix-turn-helix domain-containing protein n=1 Tax=Streptomyces sp. NPDC050636 TaxID=3154510 RepID=UPI00343C4B88